MEHLTLELWLQQPSGLSALRARGSGRELEVQTRLGVAPERRRLLDVLLFNCTPHTQTYFTLITTHTHTHTLTNHHSSSNKSPQEHSDAARV